MPARPRRGAGRDMGRDLGRDMGRGTGAVTPGGPYCGHATLQ